MNNLFERMLLFVKKSPIFEKDRPMKKMFLSLILPATALIALFAFHTKQEYTCHCITRVSTSPDPMVSAMLINDTRENAQTRCAELVDKGTDSKTLVSATCSLE